MIAQSLVIPICLGWKIKLLKYLNIIRLELKINLTKRLKSDKEEEYKTLFGELCFQNVTIHYINHIKIISLNIKSNIKRNDEYQVDKVWEHFRTCIGKF